MPRGTMACADRRGLAVMLPTFRLVLVAVGVALAALLAAGRGLITPTEGLTRVGGVPGVGRALVQQAIVGNPDAQHFSQLASVRRAEEIERLRDLPTTPTRIEAAAEEAAPPLRTDPQQTEVTPPPSAALALRPAIAPAAAPPAETAETARTEADEPDAAPEPHPATIVVPAETAGEPDRVPAPIVAALPAPAEAVDAEDINPVPEPVAAPAETPPERSETPTEATGSLPAVGPVRPAVQQAKPAVRRSRVRCEPRRMCPFRRRALMRFARASPPRPLRRQSRPVRARSSAPTTSRKPTSRPIRPTRRRRPTRQPATRLNYPSSYGTRSTAQTWAGPTRPAQPRQPAR